MSHIKEILHSTQPTIDDRMGLWGSGEVLAGEQRLRGVISRCRRHCRHDCRRRCHRRCRHRCRRRHCRHRHCRRLTPCLRDKRVRDTVLLRRPARNGSSLPVREPNRLLLMLELELRVLSPSSSVSSLESCASADSSEKMPRVALSSGTTKYWVESNSGERLGRCGASDSGKERSTSRGGTGVAGEPASRPQSRGGDTGAMDAGATGEAL